MRFDAPFVLLTAPVVALIVGAIAFWARHSRIVHARRWSDDLGARAKRSGRLSPFLLGLVAGIVMVALAGPRWGTRIVETDTKGLNMVIAVDISRSMLAEDVPPSRLERAQRQTRRLIQDLRGDRIGLIGFAQQSFVLSPLTMDDNALLLLVDALHPSLVSAGGTNLKSVLDLGHQLLLSGDQVADRVLVVFTDGEGHDSLPEFLKSAEQLRRNGVHLILVGEGGEDPVPIPVRDAEGNFVGYQRDPSDQVVQTRRREDVLNAIADAAEGIVVSADHGDQAGVIRDLVNAYKRSPQATSMAAQDVSRAWIPLFIGVMLLLLHTATRRTMALAMLLLGVGVGPVMGQAPRDPASTAWIQGDTGRSVRLYLKQALSGQGGDTAWFNAGSVALTAADTTVARDALRRAANSLDPGLRFAALYNLGFLDLRAAAADSANARNHLMEALRVYREALLLNPSSEDAKWNYELALRSMPPPEENGPPPPPDSTASPNQALSDSTLQGLTREQAEQILNSIAEEERRTRLDQNANRRDARETRGRREW